MNAIEISDLCKSYQDFTLDHLNLALPEGCIMGLVGENGAGKTTTIKLILNMIKKDGGMIRVLNRDNGENLDLTKEEIGVVLDEPGFPECITAKQINGMLKHSYQNWEEETYFSYLKKLNIPQDRKFSDFSRGMKMKLGIAAALSHRPKLLILDEATSGLDPLVREKVLDIFNEFTRDETHSVLLSSHIVSDLEKICDYIAFLHQGKLLLCEEKDVLLAEYGLVHGTAEEIARLEQSTATWIADKSNQRDRFDGNTGVILGKRESAYSVEALVRRGKVPDRMEVSPISIEELFLFMAGEG